ncbi:MAG: carboxypeptidase regulatory-like domain-containing protein [Candidatus Limnocylindria bacterium]
MRFRFPLRAGRSLFAAALVILPALAANAAPGGLRIQGELRDASGNPVPGAMIRFRAGDPAHGLSVFADETGRFRSPPLPSAGPWDVRVRRIGWRDLHATATASDPAAALALVLAREDDPAQLAAQLPANRWYQLVLARIEDPAQREELKRQCTYCHQQGSAATRVVRDEAQWRKLLALMGRMGGMLSTDLREQLPALFTAAYQPESAIPALTARMHEPDFEPPPVPEARRAVIEDWELGDRASMQHDVTMHPDGRLYSVDMSHDRLYRLDPSVPGGAREAWDIPRGELPLGGVFASVGSPQAPTSDAHVGPHSLQVAPDGAIWITLALGNQLARFDPASERFEVVALEHGFYPHTLRFDARGRIWYTIAASNHLGMYDPATQEQRELRLPARDLGQAMILRMLPMLLWMNRHLDLRGAAAESDGVTMPVPYGVDVAPDGSVWFSQLNEHRIGRVDPDSFAIEMIDTPFAAPRRLRFDAEGRLWIPSFSESLIARFDPGTRAFERWELPIEPRGSETPYALHVDAASGAVWICGTNSDTLIRFEPASERFTVYPLPTRVTYTREIAFDAQGRVWTSNSNSPAWQIEGGMPQVLRLDPDGEAVRLAASAAPPPSPVEP